MQTLRDEILQTQQTRSDLLKWKLVIAGALGSVGLGFAGAEDSAKNADLVLCAVPPVCVYVDLLSRHLSLRILVIGTFMRSHGGQYGASELAAYEAHAQHARKLGRVPWYLPLRNVSAFALEDWAVSWSTIVLSIGVLGYGVVGDPGFREPFIASGLIGLVVTVFAMSVYRRLFKATNRLAEIKGASTQPGDERLT